MNMPMFTAEASLSGGSLRIGRRVNPKGTYGIGGIIPMQGEPPWIPPEGWEDINIPEVWPPNPIYEPWYEIEIYGPWWFEWGGFGLAIVIGLALGYGIGQWIFGAPGVPATSIPTGPGGCLPKNGMPVSATVTGCYVGTQRSIDLTIANEAKDWCSKLTDYCTGRCPNGGPCKPVVIGETPRFPQGWCRAGLLPGTSTTLDFQCGCGC